MNSLGHTPVPVRDGSVDAPLPPSTRTVAVERESVYPTVALPYGASSMNEGQIVPLGKPLLDTLERMSCGAVLLDEVGHVLLSNPTAIRMLHEEVGCSPNQIENSDWARNATKSC